MTLTRRPNVTKHSDTEAQPNLEVLTMEHVFVAPIFFFYKES